MSRAEDPCGDQHRRRGRDAREIFEPNSDRVYLADAADIDPLAVIQPYPLVGDNALSEPRSLVSRIRHNVAQLSPQPTGDTAAGLSCQRDRLNLDNQRDVVDQDEAVAFDALGELAGIGRGAAACGSGT